MKLKYLVIAILILISLPVILTIISIMVWIVGAIVSALLCVAIWKTFRAERKSRHALTGRRP